jgi:hypothetical protein
MLPAANARFLDVIALSADATERDKPCQLRDPRGLLPQCRRCSSRSRDLLTLCRLRGPTNYRVGDGLSAFMPGLAQGRRPMIPNSERLVSFWYLTQNRIDGRNRGCGQALKIPKRSVCLSSVNHKLLIPSVKQPLFRFGTPDAAFPLFQLHSVAEGNPLP